MNQERLAYYAHKNLEQPLQDPQLSVRKSRARPKLTLDLKRFKRALKQWGPYAPAFGTPSERDCKELVKLGHARMIGNVREGLPTYEIIPW